jgi:beta-xylosidase
MLDAVAVLYYAKVLGTIAGLTGCSIVVSVYNHSLDGSLVFMLLTPLLTLLPDVGTPTPPMCVGWALASLGLVYYQVVKMRAQRAALASKGCRALSAPYLVLDDEPRLGHGWEVADPSIVKHKGEYFLFSTTDQSTLTVYRSHRLDKWDPARKEVIWRTDKYWWLAFVFGEGGGSGVWAPEAIMHGGKCYVYFTQGHGLYVLRGDSPVGPFEPAREIDLGVGSMGIVLDPSPFYDADGQLFLFYATFAKRRYFTGPQEVRVVRMRDYATPQGASMPVVRPDRGWEFINAVALAPRGVNEGPFLVKHREHYVLFYSGAGADTAFYNIGVAVADRPEGPYTKLCPDAGLIDIGARPGVGHCSVLVDQGRHYVVAHRKASAVTGWNRSPIIFRLDLDELLRLLMGTAAPDAAPSPAAPGNASPGARRRSVSPRAARGRQSGK